ncbi:MAG: GTPase HflX, partial [Aquiluna sp.]
GQGIAALEEAIAAALPHPEVEFRGLIPYSRGDLVSRIHLAGEVLELEYLEDGTRIRALVRPDLAGELAEFSRRS